MKTTLLVGVIKNNWKTIAVGVIAILVCIYGIVQFSNTIEQKHLNNAQTADYRASLIDSVKSVTEKAKLAEIDSIKKINYRRISDLISEINTSKSKITYYKKSATRAQFVADSLSQTKPECNDISTAYKNALDTLKMENSELDSLNEKLDNEAKTYAENLYLTEKQLKISENTIQRKDSIISIKDIYISKLEKDKSKYWKGFKAGYKWGFGSAVVLETSALILLKR